MGIRKSRPPPSFVSRPSSKSGESNGGGAASLFAGIRRSSRWSLLEDSGETSFSNRNEPFRFEEEEPGESCRYSAKSRIPAIHPCDDAVPFGGFFPHFFSAKRNGVARRRNAPVLSPSPPQRAIHGPSAHSPLASAICFPVPSPPAAYFLDMEKVGKDTPEGTYFEAVPSGLPPRRPRGLRPHWIPHFWTKDERRGFTGDEIVEFYYRICIAYSKEACFRV